MQSSLVPKRMYSVWLKILISTWIFMVIFVYLLLFGPPGFWLMIERLGLFSLLQTWKLWLQPFFTASYLS